MDSVEVEKMKAESRRATERAKERVQPGDRISRNICGASGKTKGTFTFTHWDGEWMCGAAVSGCHAMTVYAINGEPVSFAD